MGTETREQEDSNPVYDDLRSLTIEERLQVAAWFYRVHAEGSVLTFAEGLEHASEIIKPDGWQHIAPRWVVKWRARNERREPPSPPPSAWDYEVLKP